MQTITTPAISQSLIKEIFSNDCCPKQIYFSFVEGRELIDPSENMLLGRYFESELLGACRGGSKQDAKYLQINVKPNTSSNKDVKIEYLKEHGIKTDGLLVKDLDVELKKLPSDFINGEKLTAYKETDKLIDFAKEIFDKIGLVVDPNKAQEYIIEDYLSGNIDLVANDIQGSDMDALYDLKWTATKLDDRWNGWGDPDNKTDSHLQAVHYVYLFHKKYGYYPKFYFLIFGKDFWVKIIQFKISKDTINEHTNKIQQVSAKLREMSETNFKGNGDFNKCYSCPFKYDCEDKSTVPKIETYFI